MVYDTLQIDTVKFAVAEQDDARPFGNHSSNILNQLDVPLFAEVGLFVFLNQPGYGQRPPPVDDCNHECHASESDDGPVDQHDKRLTGQCLQDLPGEGEVEDFTSHVFVLYPSIALQVLGLRHVLPEDEWVVPAKCIKVSFWGGLNLGLLLMVITNLFPVGVMQLWDVIENGYWHAQS